MHTHAEEGGPGSYRSKAGGAQVEVTPNQLGLGAISRISESDLESLLHGAAKGLSLMAEGKCAAQITQMTAR